jgi:hypothetical protein
MRHDFHNWAHFGGRRIGGGTRRKFLAILRGVGSGVPDLARATATPAWQGLPSVTSQS